MEPKTLLLSLVLLPFIGGLGSLAIPIFNRKYISLSFVMLVCVLLVLSQSYSFKVPLLVSFVWIRGFDLTLQADKLSLVLCGLVAFIGFLVSLFSSNYIHEEKNVDRYFLLLGLFLSSMMGVFLANDLLFLFVFWELVGVSSFLLIGFWYLDAEKANAARVAFMTNRVSDLFLLLGILLLFSYSGTFSFYKLSPLPSDNLLVGLASSCLVLGAMGKSAQFPFFTWLPHAMVGPTPISALIHAATMVTAGVYLIVRLNPIFPEEVKFFIIWIGGITLLIGSLSAMFQHDIKKVLAYSTISQLGYMFMAAGFDTTLYAVSHIISHAFFKAGLFLSAALIIEYMQSFLSHEKALDIRKMGGLRYNLPLYFILFLIMVSSLAAVPFTSGFISKENILLGLFQWNNSHQDLGLVLIYSTSFAGLVTAFYSGRLVSSIFLGELRLPLSPYQVSWKYTLPIIACSGLSIFWLFSSNPFSHQVWIANWIELKDTLTLFPQSVYLVSLGSVVVFITSTWLYASKYRTALFDWEDNSWVAFLKNGFYVNRIYQRQISPYFYKSGHLLAAVDRQIIDRFVRLIAIVGVLLGKVADLFDKLVVDGGVKIIAGLTGFIGWLTSRMNGSRVQSQMLWALFGLVVLLWLFNDWILI